MSAYVLTRWHAKDLPDKEGCYVNIAGREGGIIAWVLTLLGVSPTVLLRVNGNVLEFEETSFFRHISVSTPLRKITSSISGHERPVGKSAAVAFLIWIISSTIGGLIAGLASGSSGGTALFILSQIGAIIFSIIVGVIYCWINGAATLGIVSDSGEIYWVRLKRSLIEGIKVDRDTTASASAVINRLLMESMTTVPTSTVGVPTLKPLQKKSMPVQETLPPGEKSINCEHCNQHIVYPKELSGKESTCPDCGKSIILW